MLEILVVVAIIAVLLGFGFHAYKKVIISGRTNATRVTLGNLKGMLAELESQSGSVKSPVVWTWINVNGAGFDFPQPVQRPTPVPYTPNFWKDPYHFPDDDLITNGNGGLGHYDSLYAPSDVTPESDVGLQQRFASIAVVNTGIAMNFLASVQANKSRLGAIPADQTLVLEWKSGEIPVPDLDHFLGTMDDSAPPTPVRYVPGTHVRYNDKRYVAAAPWNFSVNPAPVINATTGPWYDETNTPNANPVLLDGWGNPIIFVPATGLRVRLVNTKDKLDPTDKTQNIIIVSPEGQVQKYDPTLPNTPYVITPGRPFWASAGPDGNFATGDDNLYSFEQ